MISLEGKIIRGIAGFFDVRVTKDIVYRCRAKGTFRREGLRPVTGDNVSFEVTHEGDREGNLTDVHPRKNALLRPPVTNVDMAVLVFAYGSPAVSHYLLDRFLIMMRQKEVPVILVFNKKDLAEDSEVLETERVYAEAGCQVFSVSAHTREGIDAVVLELLGKTAVVAGPSGVGKSSLINLLTGSEQMETGALSDKIGRGKNTTRHSELFEIDASLFPAGTDEKLAEQTYVCDTPGFMSLKPEGIEPRDLHLYYPEFTKRDAGCRFGGCTHLSEPDCAVKEALFRGEIPQIRYDTYKLLYEELSGARPVYVKKAKKEQRQL